MLKAVAQSTLLARMAAGMLATVLLVFTGDPFWSFLGLVGAWSAVFFFVAAITSSSGRTRTAGVLLVVSGAVFLLAGVLLFAPQPLWVGALMIGLGVVTLVCHPNTVSEDS